MWEACRGSKGPVARVLDGLGRLDLEVWFDEDAAALVEALRWP